MFDILFRTGNDWETVTMQVRQVKRLLLGSVCCCMPTTGSNPASQRSAWMSFSPLNLLAVNPKPNMHIVIRKIMVKQSIIILVGFYFSILLRGCHDTQH